MGSKMPTFKAQPEDLAPSSRKTISLKRDRMQSDLLLGGIGALLVMKTVGIVVAMYRHGGYPSWFWVACGCSVGFALIVWLLRSATGPAAATGGLICLDVLLGQNSVRSWQNTAMPALLALFILTFAATRFGRIRKQRMGLAEPKHGRRASQVIANLGIAGLCAGASSSLLFAACLAALAEATADTVSSEIGQAVGGRTLLVTTWSEVPAGTNGGISIAGTTLGATAAGAIVLLTAAVGWLPSETGLVVLGTAIAGLLFDSYLGATVERCGWLGNDLVNSCSTAFAAALAGLGVYLLR